MIKNPSQRLIEFVVDNLLDFATIGIAAYIVIRHQISPFPPDQAIDLLSGVLAVLALLAISGVWDKSRRLGRIQREVSAMRTFLSDKFEKRPLAEEFLGRGSSVTDETFKSAMQIDLAGITLTRTSRQHAFVLSQRLVAGAHIRIVLVDPDSETILEEMVQRSLGQTTQEFWRTRLRNATSVVEAIGSIPGNCGKLEIGFLPYLPAFGLVLTDPTEAHGLCYVEVNHHKTAEPNPTFMLAASSDRQWFQFFRDQFEIFWQSCRKQVVNPSNSEP